MLEYRTEVRSKTKAAYEIDVYWPDSDSVT